MKEKEQSSIEWLIQEIEQRNGIIESETDPLVRGSMIHYGYGDLYEQAKELHKIQTIQTCDDVDSTDFWVEYESYEDYYNKKYLTE